MDRSVIRLITGLASPVAAFLLLAGSAGAQQKLDSNAQLCLDFEQTVIFGGMVDEAPKFITDDYIEHNVNDAASGIQDYMAKMKARTTTPGRGRGGRGGGRAGGAAPQQVVFSHDDVVIFVRERAPQDDPSNPGKKIPGGTHFDVWRMRNGKIAEHWD